MRFYFQLFFALASLAFATVSCSKETNQVQKDSILTVSIEFFNSTMKSTEAYADESKINDVKLFVDKVEPTTGDAEPYAEYYCTTGSVEVDLEFPEDDDYAYNFRAYANFGEIADEPSVVTFSGYFDNGMKMHGESLVNEATASSGSLSMMLKRYVGKVIVNSVNLSLGSSYNEPFTLDAIYIANAGKDNSILAETYYNVNGVRNITDMDQYLYEDLGGISMANGDTHSQQHVFYAFPGLTSEEYTSLVFEATYAGEKMYYTISLDFLMDNSCSVYDFIICGAGYDAPFGEKMEMTKSPLEVIVRNFTVEEWDTYTKRVSSEGNSYVNTEIEVKPDYGK